MTRSVWKVPYISSTYFCKFFLKRNGLKVWNRYSLIPANLVGKVARVHNGTWHLAIVVKSNLIGHKFGEFSFTKRTGVDIHRGSKKKKK